MLPSNNQDGQFSCEEVMMSQKSKESEAAMEEEMISLNEPKGRISGAVAKTYTVKTKWIHDQKTDGQNNPTCY